MPTYEQRDIVIVEFPYSTRTSIKKRPAIIISSDWFNTKRDEVIVLAITSNNNEQRDKFPIQPRFTNECRLNQDSSVKTGTFLTIHKQFIIKKLGKLDLGEFKKLVKYYMDVLGYPEKVKI
ncbi:pemK-like protein [archaeon BMS3Abin16]|nr:pemK-like protein [archaeon BMS3Abin16]HDY73814.1 type II toxin-antitoxin system PemK/MazF family toxin [Euryarchaeota archaeon]